MTTRRLAVIMAADIVGFSAMMEREEESTFARVMTLRRDLLEPKIAQHGGRTVKTTGDGFLVEFTSAVEAVKCGLAIQAQGAAGGDGDAAKPIKLRMGINLGDVIIEQDGDVYGDGVNVAARLEQICDPGCLFISGKVHDEIVGKLEAPFESRGSKQVKNLARPVRVFAWTPAVAPLVAMPDAATEVPVEVVEDPGHPEGGHALILFRGVSKAVDAATLSIEPLAKGAIYEGPRQLAVASLATPDGLQLSVGPNVVAKLVPGISVALTLVGPNVFGEVLWPALRQLRPATKARLGQRGPRRVVAPPDSAPAGGRERGDQPMQVEAARLEEATAGDGFARQPSSPERQPVAAASPRAAPALDKQPVSIDPEGWASPPAAAALGDAVVAAKAPVPEPQAGEGVSDAAKAQAFIGSPGGLPAPGGGADPATDAERPVAGKPGRGVGVPALVLVAVCAFAAGLIAMGGIWALAPAPLAPATNAAADIKLPSPFDMLASLAARSPTGRPLKMEEQAQFLQLGRQAQDPQESAFWKSWATRAMLENRGTGVAATLSDFATELANAHSDASGLAAARFLWEMAAVSQDCAAMTNIVASLRAAGGPANLELAKTWNARATQCPPRK